MSKRLSLGLPNGSLAERLRMYLERAGFPLPNSPDRRGYLGVSNGIDFYQLDRRMLPYFVANGSFDACITGMDIYLNSSTELRELATLKFARSSDRSSRWVLAVKRDFHPRSKVVIGCELPRFAEVALARHDKRLQFDYEIIQIDGSEEQAVVHGLLDAVFVVTESGVSLKANDLVPYLGFHNVFESQPAIYIKENLLKESYSYIRDQLEALSIALQSVIAANDFVEISFNFPIDLDLSTLNLPADKSPTIAPLADSNWCSGTICIKHSEFAHVSLQLMRAGAKNILMKEVQGHL